MPFSFGPPIVDLPSAEYLGELLNDARRFEDSVAAYETQLERTRLRANALEGLAGALDQTGAESEAKYAREKLRLIRQQEEAPTE